MASKHNSSAVSQDTLITIKISVNEQLKKLKLPLRDLGASVLPDKLRLVLDIKPEQVVMLERFSDSAGGYITLNQSNPQVFKTLIRAAKAKGKLRLKATVTPVVVPQEKDTVEVTAAPKQMEPIIVRSPVHLARPSQAPEHHHSQLFQAPLPRESVSFDRRSIGSGIFQFRDARNSQQTLINDEAPVPQAFVDQSAFLDGLAAPIVPQKLVFRPRETAGASEQYSKDYSVYCNACGAATYDVHYHCSICHDGDYDLCEKCVDGGKVCPGDSHWLIKRFSRDGEYVHSTTTRISSEKAPLASAPSSAEMKATLGAFVDETNTIKPEGHTPLRTCNSCVVVLPEHEFVTCQDCEDYDLCIPCHVADKHAHHPAHSFKPSTEATVLPLAAETKLAAGRNVRHNAICDGCDKTIYGIRHKCLNCPDWDYCNDCVKTARQSHPHHRFAALYTPIADQGVPMVRHFGIHCDGPLCSKKANQPFINGVRYKCTICHDTDFCASCEALPGNHHNRTHPLIKLKTPVRNVSVSTENEDQGGQVRHMGDRHSTLVSVPVTAPSPVQTVAEIKPTEVKRDTAPILVPVKKYEAPAAPQANRPQSEVPSALLDACFVRDTIPDGMVVEPETRFTQVWTMKNPGPFAWPAGCSVRYVGGDNMLNVDNSHPASVAAINEATESNVVGRKVDVGQEVAFKVVMKAPLREGKSISYWRVKAADGTPFGNRLWCDIEVKKAEQIEVPVAPMAPVMAPVMQAAPFMPVRPSGPRASLPPPPARLSQPPIPTEHPPAYYSMDSMNLSARLAAMREQQKQRRDQMLAQLNAQREQVTAPGTSTWKREEMPSWANHSSAQMGKEALRQRVAQIKANLQKTREERERFQGEHTKLQIAAAEKKAREDCDNVKKIVEQVTKVDEIERSQMVFPKLDKESPSSSTYESATSSSHKGKAAYVENETGEIERSASPSGPQGPVVYSPSAEAHDFVEFDDDLEVLSASEEDSEDDGFLTDEEYDILDASDHETVVSL